MSEAMISMENDVELTSGKYITFFEISLSLSPYRASASGKSGKVTRLWDASSLSYEKKDL